MKKYIFITIGIFIISELVVCFIYVKSTNDNTLEITKTMMQAITSGIITFIGLLFTILFQEKQSEHKQSTELCPCFVINSDGTAGAKENGTDFDNTSITVICSSAAQVRLIQCKLFNAKNNQALNVSISNNKNENYLGSTGDKELIRNLILKSEGVDEFFINFEDVYGIKYKQKIIYEYFKDNNNYKFVSNMPEKEKNKKWKKV